MPLERVKMVEVIMIREMNSEKTKGQKRAMPKYQRNQLFPASVALLFFYSIPIQCLHYFCIVPSLFSQGVPPAMVRDSAIKDSTMAVRNEKC